MRYKWGEYVAVSLLVLLQCHMIKSNCALISVSNLSPRIPELDILNIPFWLSSPQEYAALCSSGVWQRHILSKFEKHNYYPLLHYCEYCLPE